MVPSATQVPTKVEIRELSDLDLVRAVRVVGTSSGFDKLSYDLYERRFIENLPNEFSRYGTLTWRQRKMARELVIQAIGEMQLRQLVVEEPSPPKRKRGRPRKTNADSESAETKKP